MPELRPCSRALLSWSCLASACGAPATSPARPDTTAVAATTDVEVTPISQFVRRIHEDRHGNLWLGTNGDGIARWNGQQLEWFSTAEGLPGVAVRGIAEDAAGNIWIGTEHGVSKFDGERFLHYSSQHGLPHDDVWCLEMTRDGTLWVGTFAGACRFDGVRFSPFALPHGTVDPDRGVSSATIVHSITEDATALPAAATQGLPFGAMHRTVRPQGAAATSIGDDYRREGLDESAHHAEIRDRSRSGRLWFGTSGGAFVYDGERLTSYGMAEGMPESNVNCVAQDRRGRVWFATHYHGVSYLEGDRITAVTEADGVHGVEVWDLFLDRDGDVWFPVENAGVYRFDGERFHNYAAAQGLTSNAIQCTHQDRNGRIWLGGYGGLFRVEGERVVAVGVDGPWR